MSAAMDADGKNEIMNPPVTPRNRRILVIDDNEAIHRDFRKILVPRCGDLREGVEAIEAELFGDAAPVQPKRGADFTVDSAYQGNEGVRLAGAAVEAGTPYAMAFVDVRMPPGWDGIETTEHLWQADPDLLIVICTAYSDYNWESMVERLGETDRLLILKKPFDAIEVVQLALALTEKWCLRRTARMKLGQMEAIVAERTASLHQEIEWRRSTECKLAAARDEAEAANRAKSEFLANMSHEIRTPMNGILGMCQLLAGDDTLSQGHRHLVDTLASSGEVLLALLNDILDLSKIEANRLKLEVAPFCPGKVVQDTVCLFAATTRMKGIELTCETAMDTDALFLGDAVRLRQILQNFLANAVKFTSKGEIHVRAAYRPLGNAVDEITLSVRDTGIGITPEKQKRLFQPFTQADSSITRRFGGTGLGLAICARLADMMDGRIEFESAPGRGSTFTLVVPMRAAHAGESAKESAPAPQSVPAPSAGERAEAPESTPEYEPIRALIAEDNAVSRKVATLLLERMGVQSDTVCTGKEAVQAVESQSYDIVFMDCQMPEMDGFKATQEIRRREAAASRPRMPVIAMTAGATKEYKDLCRDAGMDAFIAKPVRKSELVEVLDRFTNEIEIERVQ
ncbi:MAG: response regulator [Opitutales bacterium]|nr:response regulator [Opitutales bacterium]